MIPVPERPQLAELPPESDLEDMDAEALKLAYKAAVANMESVGSWGLRYESVVAKYNELAKAANIKNGYVLADEETPVTPTE